MVDSRNLYIIFCSHLRIPGMYHDRALEHRPERPQHFDELPDQGGCQGIRTWQLQYHRVLWNITVAAASIQKFQSYLRLLGCWSSQDMWISPIFFGVTGVSKCFGDEYMLINMHI